MPCVVILSFSTGSCHLAEPAKLHWQHLLRRPLRHHGANLSRPKVWFHYNCKACKVQVIVNVARKKLTRRFLRDVGRFLWRNDLHLEENKYNNFKRQLVKFLFSPTYRSCAIYIAFMLCTPSAGRSRKT